MRSRKSPSQPASPPPVPLLGPPLAPLLVPASTLSSRHIPAAETVGEVDAFTHLAADDTQKQGPAWLRCITGAVA
ncbi:hypothetical protein HYQ46_003344 [Verticillium longisporum]|nr:hypothetical protein HYQ46_003344 [Verticillium longisporum]